MSDSKNHYKSVDEVEAVTRGFESCAIAPADFSHGAHMIVAFSYLHLSRLSVTEATGRVRAGLYRYLDHHGVDRQKYNETITIFWIKLVRAFLDRTDNARPAEEIANEMIDAYSSSQIIYDYYTKERLSSEEARKEWVEPDVKPLDF